MVWDDRMLWVMIAGDMQGRQKKKSTGVLNLFQRLIIIVKNQFEYARGGKVSVMVNEYML